MNKVEAQHIGADLFICVSIKGLQYRFGNIYI
jgi:hypothetical protein